MAKNFDGMNILQVKWIEKYVRGVRPVFPSSNFRPLTTNVSPAPHRLNASNRLSPERLFQVIPCLKLATYNTSFVDCFNQTFFKFNETKCVTFHQLQA